MAPTIAAQPVEYKGIKYRSKAEARWAIFFDAAGIRVEYEEEYYELPSGFYLPDFWIPELDIFFEVKGSWESDLSKQKDLKDATGKPVVVAIGPPGSNMAEYEKAAKGGFWVPFSNLRTFGNLCPDGCHGGGGAWDFYYDEYNGWGKWELDREPHKVEDSVREHTLSLVLAAMNYRFPRWNAPGKYR